MLSDDIPYLEMLYRFVFGEKRSYYDLQVTKDVKPQAQKDEARTLPVRGLAVTERPQQVPKQYFDPFDIEIEEHDFYP